MYGDCNDGVGYSRDGDEIARGIERYLLLDQRVDSERGREPIEQRMIVIGVGKRTCTHTRIGTWAVLDDDRLAPSLAKSISDEPRGCIRCRADTNRDDDSHAANRPGWAPISRRCAGAERAAL